jgi:hypothetical protein
MTLTRKPIVSSAAAAILLSGVAASIALPAQARAASSTARLSADAAPQLVRADWDDHDDGDWRRDDQGGVYPQFQDEEDHIRGELNDAMRWRQIDRDDARAAFDQLHRIQWQERREFSEHGWRLPDPDEDRIRDQLDRLDRWVDHLRDDD